MHASEQVCVSAGRRTRLVDDIVGLLLVQVLRDVLGINHRQHRVQLAHVLEIVVHKECLCALQQAGRSGRRGRLGFAVRRDRRVGFARVREQHNQPACMLQVVASASGNKTAA